MRSIASRTEGVLNVPQGTLSCKKTLSFDKVFLLVGEDGFEPSKRYAADLQSVPFGHSGTPPDMNLVRSVWSR